MITEKRSYSFFSETEYSKMGRLAADRDAFLLLFEVARTSVPLNLLKLCGRFRATPGLVKEVFSELVALGMGSMRAGTYVATPFGESVIDLMEDVANEFSPHTEVPKTHIGSVTMAQDYSLAATNNSVRGTFSNSVSIENKTLAFHKLSATATTTDRNLAEGRGGQAEVENASRNNNYLR